MVLIDGSEQGVRISSSEGRSKGIPRFIELFARNPWSSAATTHFEAFWTPRCVLVIVKIKGLEVSSM